ncbi:phasin family protein [Paraburkholderia sp. PREW-6R]|uniref:phasin family protein n=1 Tax=Paraburkholderia sp. PREW-6R TaxID=3141544 RepID=UPI0031F5CAE8
MYADTLNQISSRQRNSAVEGTFDCTAEAMSGIEKVIELNLQTVKTSLSEQQALAHAALSARSMSEAIDLQSQQFPATIKKTFAYWRHVEEIAVETRLGLFSAMQERFQNSLRTFAEMVDAASGSFANQANANTERLLVAADDVSAQATANTVAIVDSAGNVVSSDDVRGDLH